MSYRVLCSMVMVLLLSQPAMAKGRIAWFEMAAGDPDNRTFIIKLTTPETIRRARDILSGKLPGQLMLGYVVPVSVPYNPGWSFHVDTDTIEFVDFAVEVCDASVSYVEENLAAVGSDFLPGNIWCPWSTELIGEVVPNRVEAP